MMEDAWLVRAPARDDADCVVVGDQSPDVDVDEQYSTQRWLKDPTTLVV